MVVVSLSLIVKSVPLMYRQAFIVGDTIEQVYLSNVYSNLLIQLKAASKILVFRNKP
jgi:hypothetical protein